VHEGTHLVSLNQRAGQVSTVVATTVTTYMIYLLCEYMDEKVSSRIR